MERKSSVAARLLVPSDIVDVGSGEAFPADAIVLNGSKLQADSASPPGLDCDLGARWGTRALLWTPYPWLQAPLRMPPLESGPAEG
jgi:hypothetical protein